MNTRHLTFCAAALLCVGAVAQANNLYTDDATFFKDSARSGQFEIDASKLAADHSSNPDVKQYANEMVSAHTQVAAQLSDLAKKKQFKLPSGVSPAQQKTLKELAGKNGKNFDQQYTNEIAVAAHQDAVKTFTYTAQGGKDDEIKAFAAKVQPDLQKHLAEGRALKAKVSASQAEGSGDSRGTKTTTPVDESHRGQGS